ncbi:hypothetical protein C9374_002369 [Naegleria lovaniensis]|uniref:Uncharacterized protein n=1 Tax=Naegleria lovaniensis TaxID=51637 RepID=A0AA88GTJ5_NAELO|nr:uncharacterized protein C9374_002369 [Naegleria lovaniensis]KAG2386625.1 hypothetical protein C9374_002369 [Naegleria lovaniensis]
MLNKNLKRRHSASSSSLSSSSSVGSSNSLTDEENNYNSNRNQQPIASIQPNRNVNVGGSIHSVVMANATVISPNDLKASGQKVFQANPSPGHVPQKKKRKSPSQKHTSSGISPASSSNTNHSLPSNHTHEQPQPQNNNDNIQNSALRSKITSEQIAYCPSCAFIGNKSHLPQSVLSVGVETNFNSQTVSLNERYEPIYHQFLVKLVVSRPFNRLSFHLNSFEAKNSVVFNVNREPSPIEDGNIHHLAISFSSIYLSAAVLTDPLISSTNLPFLTEKSVKPFVHFGNVDCRGNEIFIPLQFLCENPEKYLYQHYQIMSSNANEYQGKFIIGGTLDVQAVVHYSSPQSPHGSTNSSSTILGSSEVKFTFPFSVNKTTISPNLPSNLLQGDLPLIYHDVRTNGKGTLLWYPIHVPFLSPGLKLLCLLAHNSAVDKHRDLFGKISNESEQRYLNVGSLLLEFINGLMSEQKKRYSYVYELKNQQVFPMHEKKTVKILTHSNLHKYKIGDEGYITNHNFYTSEHSDILWQQNKCLVKILQYGVCKKYINGSPYDSLSSTNEGDNIEIVYLIEYPTKHGPKTVFIIESEIQSIAATPSDISEEEAKTKESNEKLYNEALQEVYNINTQDLLNLEKKYQLQQLNEEPEYHQTNHFKGDLHLHGNLLIKGHVKIERQVSQVERVIMNIDTKHHDYYMLYIDSIPSDVPIKVMLCFCSRLASDHSVKVQPITIIETPNHFIYPKPEKKESISEVWFECRSTTNTKEKLESTTPLPFLFTPNDVKNTSEPTTDVLIPLSWQHYFKSSATLEK